MSMDNTTAVHTTTGQDGAVLGMGALIVGAIALVLCIVPIAAGVLGAGAAVLGVVAMKRPAAAKLGRIGLVLGVAAIFAGLFVFNLLASGMISF
jgi:hypothetical protein